MEYNQEMLAALLTASGTIYAFMEAIGKPFAKRFYAQLLAALKRDVEPNEQSDHMAVLFRVGTVVLGIAFVVANPDGMLSLMKLWRYSIPDDWLVIDQIATGCAIGLGDRAIHWVVDFGEGSGKSFLVWLDAKLNHEID